MSSPYPGEPQRRLSWTLLGSIAGLVVLALIAVAGILWMNRGGSLPLIGKSEPSQATAIGSNATRPTEVFFLDGLKPQPGSNDTEWSAARSDHQLVAYGVFNCKQLSDVATDVLPRHAFSALMLDLTPSGSHVFLMKSGDEAALANRDKDQKVLQLTGDDRELLALSDSIARARIAAAEGAGANFPWVQRLGLATLIVSAFATLFVTLQGKMSPVELTDDEQKALQREKLRRRLWYVSFGPGSGFRWVAFFAIALSIAGTSLTGLKQVYDPTRTLSQNTRALLDLRQLHQEIILAVKCDSQRKSVTRDNRIEAWANAIRRLRATIIPDYGSFANLDVGGSSQRPDLTQTVPQPLTQAGNAAPSSNVSPAAAAPSPPDTAAPPAGPQ